VACIAETKAPSDKFDVLGCVMLEDVLEELMQQEITDSNDAVLSESRVYTASRRHEYGTTDVVMPHSPFGTPTAGGRLSAQAASEPDTTNAFVSRPLVDFVCPVSPVCLSGGCLVLFELRFAI
jgi:hypothetical protein